MSKAMPSLLRTALCASAAIISMAALGAPAGSAATVKLRIEGQTQTQFNGTVTTGPRSVPGGVDNPAGCRSNATAPSFATATPLTAVADALGDANLTTSGTFFGFGTLLCSVNGEATADASAGWLIRINQADSTAPAGYVTATDPLSEGDSVLFFYSPSYGAFTSALELKLPASAKPGEPVGGIVESYDMTTDAKSPGAGAAVSGGGASASAAADGGVSLTFPAAGRYLVTATRSGAVRGSAWIDVDAGATPAPVRPTSQKDLNKRRRVAARAKCRADHPKRSGEAYAACIRTANSLGHTKTAKQKRIDARAKCVANYPQSGSASRVRCIRAANGIGR